MKNELAGLTGISFLAEIPAKWAVFFSYDCSLMHDFHKHFHKKKKIIIKS